MPDDEPPHPSNAPFVPGEVLVKTDGSISEIVDGLAFGYPVTIKERVEPLRVVRLEVPEGKELETIERLKSSHLVEWAEPNYLRSAMRVPNDERYQQFQWNLRKIRAEQAWDITTGSANTIVAVLDTGVDKSHPDLAKKLVQGYDFLNDDDDPSDDSGHGTYAAGIIGANTNNKIGVAGISWGARIMPVKVLNSSGIGPDYVIAKGIIYAVDNGARIINLSFGTSIGSEVQAEAVHYAAEHGVLLVAAAGNTAKVDNETVYPAAYDEVLAVGATDDQDKIADFSQHHPYVSVSAPGVQVFSTFWQGSGYGAYIFHSGTSVAAPHVSGEAALIWSVNPDLSAAEVRKIIEESCDDLGTPGKDEYYGYGRINIDRALGIARPAIQPSPTPTAEGPPATPTAASPTPAGTPAASPQATPATLPRTVWYFAEGSTAKPFDLWLLLQNPNSSATTARVTYMKQNGSAQAQEIWLPPISRKSIYVNQAVPDSEVSIKVESSALIFAERAMYFGHDGHDSVGTAAPATAWYMAEGSTKTGYDTWILIQNPSTAPANAIVTLFTTEGQRKQVPMFIPPTSRRSLYVNDVLADTNLSAMVTSDQPIIAERAMYFGQGGGHGSMATSQLSKNWYLAEGQTGPDFDTWILALNPNQLPANLKVTFMREDGSTVENYYIAQPYSRFSLYVNDMVPPGAVGARVESDQPIAVERSSYFANGTGGHNVVGTPLLAQDWYLPEGTTKAPFTEIIAVLNPNEKAGNLTVSFMRADGTITHRFVTMRPTSRLTLRANELLPNTEASVKLSSDVPIAVERSMYFADGRGGTSSIGIPR